MRQLSFVCVGVLLTCVLSFKSKCNIRIVEDQYHLYVVNLTFYIYSCQCQKLIHTCENVYLKTHFVCLYTSSIYRQVFLRKEGGGLFVIFLILI